MIKETDLARQLGLPRDRIRELRRRLATGIHVCLVDGAMTYTDEGVKKMAALIGLASPDLDPAPVQTQAEAGSQATGQPDEGVGEKMARVTTVYAVNFNYLEAQLPDGQKIRVRVASNRNFLPGMEIPVRRDGEAVWVLTRRAPRARGRW